MPAHPNDATAGDSLAGIADRLRRRTGELAFAAPVAHVYRPLVYAWEVHAAYLERFGGGPKEIVLVGMNPGPWGMAQTGVPFGEIAAVRDWLRLDGKIGRPPRPHPKKPVEGFACRRREVSGKRLWGWARRRFGAPERFFARFFVANYCPLLFLDAGGRNLTPDKLPAAERRALVAPCDRALRETVETLGPRLVVGVGAFAEARARAALEGLPVGIGRILHPSPASPAANRGWQKAAEEQLAKLGVELPG